jgi:hypothetical protein
MAETKVNKCFWENVSYSIIKTIENAVHYKVYCNEIWHTGIDIVREKVTYETTLFSEKLGGFLPGMTFLLIMPVAA